MNADRVPSHHDAAVAEFIDVLARCIALAHLNRLDDKSIVLQEIEDADGNRTSATATKSRSKPSRSRALKK